MAALKAKGLPTYTDREMFMELIHASDYAPRGTLSLLVEERGLVESTSHFQCKFLKDNTHKNSLDL